MNAVITGATKGMGRAIAEKLAKAGYNLIICSRSQSDIDSFCEHLMSTNKLIKAIGLSTNCENPLEVKAFVNFTNQHFPAVDVLINNVGIFQPGSLLDESPSEFSAQWQINYFAAHTLCAEFGKSMRSRQSGYIINICSIASESPLAEAGTYSVTKAALLTLTKVLRLELLKHNVKVTAILPGSTLTSSWEGTEVSADRFIRTEDIADAVLYCVQTSGGANVEQINIHPLGGQI